MRSLMSNNEATQWQTAVPTLQGWYWHKRRPRSRPRIVEISKHWDIDIAHLKFEDKGMLLWYKRDEEGVPLDWYCEISKEAQWWGPIQPPNNALC